MIFGVVLVLTGVVWFLQSIGWVDSTIWNLYFPLVLVVFGLSILFASEEHACLMCKVMDRSNEKEVVKKEVAVAPKKTEVKKTTKTSRAKTTKTKKSTTERRTTAKKKK